MSPRSRTRSAALVVASALALAGHPGSAAAQVPEPGGRPAADAPLDREELGRRLDRLTEDPALLHAHVGLHVEVAETGEVLYDRAGRKRFTAASTAKLLTAAVALERLGPGYRWRTRLVAGGPILGDTLEGDLHVVGSGDPSLRIADLERWARALRGAGVRWIRGDVIADDRAFAAPIWGRGWMWDELHLGWATGVSGLQLSDAAIVARLRPGRASGDPASVTPGAAGLPVDVAVETGPPGSELRLRYLPGTDGGRGRVVGWVPLDRESVRLSFAPEHPTDQLLRHLGRALAEAGIRWEGRLRRVAADAPAPPAGRGRWSAAFRSDSLGAVLPRVLRTSDNQGAESLLRTVGREAGREGSAAEGIRVLEETLAGWGVAPGAVHLADGSGLSRYDETTPEALVRVLRAMWQSPHHRVFRRSLPAPGDWGTLRHRLHGTPARDALRAKTGSLSSVRGLAGYVEDGDGETLIFALLLQGYDAPGSTASALRDFLVEQLSLYHRPVVPGWPAQRDGG